MRLPTYDEIARYEEQLEVYETPFTESLLVVGPPGSGKTILAIHRAQMLAKNDIQVVLITYNRMLRRLIAQLSAHQVRAQTMHAFVAKTYQEQINVQAPIAASYVYDWNSMFATLSQCGVAPQPMHVIVDEGQDLQKEFFRYLREFVATSVTVFSDEDQALSGPRTTLRDIRDAGRLPDPVLLSANHRNSPEIARVAEYFHAGNAPAPMVHRPPTGELPRLILYSDNGAVERICNWYRARGGRVGVAVVNNRFGGAICSLLRYQLAGQRVQIYTSDRENEDQIDLLQPGITILNVQSIKGQEFDALFIMEIADLLLEVDDVNKRKMYMLCARARSNLFLMHEGDHLPCRLLKQLPGTDILERS